MNQKKQIWSIFRHILLLSMINCFFIGLVSGQSSPKGARVINVSDTSKIGTTWAVIVGISKYQNVHSLNYADKDALAFYDYLVNKKGTDPKHIQLLINEKAIASDIYGALEWLNLSIKENDRVIFYFSGHGDVETRTLHQNGFLLANDAPVAAYMTKGTVSVNYLQDYLETYVAGKKAKDVILIVDACRAGKLAGGTEGIQITMHALGQNWNNQIIKILSAQEGESSFEDKKWGGGRGVFSYYLVKGLEGLANRNADRIITTSELAAYLPFAVAEATNSVQNPTVSGNPKINLFAFNKSLLALANQQDNKPESGQLIASRGTNDDLDPEIEKWYSQYRSYLQKGRLIWGEKQIDTINCARFYYLKLVKDDRAKTLLPSLKSSFVASLKHKAETQLDAYIKHDNDIEYIDDEVYREMALAKTLIDTSYILYNYINARLLFIEGCNSKKPADAVKYFYKVIKTEPDAAYAYNKLGESFEKLDIADSAVYYYKKAITLSPTWALTENALGQYLNDQRRYQDAIDYLEKGIKLDSAAAYIYFNLAFSYDKLYPNRKKGDSILDIGIRANKSLLGKDSIKARSTYYLGALYEFKGDFENAIKYLKMTIAVDSAHYGIYKILGDIYGNPAYQKYNLAIEYYKKAIKLSPNNDLLYAEIADIYLKANRFADVIESLKKAIELGPANNDNYIALSNAYLFISKNFKKALEISSTALNIHPEKPENYSQMWKVYMKLKNYTKAKEFYKKAIAQANLESDAYHDFADFYYQEGDIENFVSALLTAIDYDDSDSKNYYDVARGYALVNEKENSLKYLKTALEKGYNDYLDLSTNTDFTNIKLLPGYKELLKKYFPDQAK